MIHSILKNKLSNVHTIFEIGGHNGADTVILHKNFPNAIIHSFEANKDMCNKHLAKLRSNNIKIINKAVGQSNGKVKFYVDKNKRGDQGASSLLKSTPGYLRHYLKAEQEIEVESIRMEDYMKYNGIKKINLLWMDIEGYEYYVLNDSRHVLKNVQYIYLEVNFKYFRNHTVLFPQVNKLMSNLRFELIYKESQGSRRWGEWQGNVLYRNKDYVE